MAPALHECMEPAFKCVSLAPVQSGETKSEQELVHQCTSLCPTQQRQLATLLFDFTNFLPLSHLTLGEQTWSSIIFGLEIISPFVHHPDVYPLDNGTRFVLNYTIDTRPYHIRKRNYPAVQQPMGIPTSPCQKQRPVCTSLWVHSILIDVEREPRVPVDIMHQSYTDVQMSASGSVTLLRNTLSNLSKSAIC